MGVDVDVDAGGVAEEMEAETGGPIAARSGTYGTGTLNLVVVVILVLDPEWRVAAPSKGEARQRGSRAFHAG